MVDVGNVEFNVDLLIHARLTLLVVVQTRKGLCIVEVAHGRELSFHLRFTCFLFFPVGHKLCRSKSFGQRMLGLFTT